MKYVENKDLLSVFKVLEILSMVKEQRFQILLEKDYAFLTKG